MRHMPRGEAIDWRNEVPIDLVIRVDPDDLGEVVGNLLDNARKWANSRVLVRGTRDGQRARISILDDGPGFGSAAPDLRTNRGVSSGPDSTGLGLGIVHDILAEYGGELQVGEVDGLCSVSFTLPTDAAVETTAPAASVDEAEMAVRPLSKIA